MPILSAPFPAGERFVKDDGTLADKALLWLVDQGGILTSAPRKLGAGVDLEAHAATIATTPIYSNAIPAGLYRVSYYIQVTRAAGVSSDFTFSLTWTNFGVAQSFTGSTKNGNTTTTYEQGTIVFRADENTPVSYSVVYNSVGAPTMQYFLGATLEQLNA